MYLEAEAEKDPTRGRRLLDLGYSRTSAVPAAVVEWRVTSFGAAHARWR
jgi:hypothetical protein